MLTRVLSVPSTIDFCASESPSPPAFTDDCMKRGLSMRRKPSPIR